jgi:predicted 3-demethylubiquinone-9 3-methyltransferase (glyoxalase superfamily)
MKSPVYPCLWFDNNGSEAAEFYSSVFGGGRVLSSSPLVTTFELIGTEFMALNGGSMYKMTQAVSYTVYCESEDETRRLFNSLRKDGKVFFTLDKYNWSPSYAWVEDKFGVSWQLDASQTAHAQKIVPTLLFVNGKNGRVKEALSFYEEIFPDSGTYFSAPHSPESGMPDGALLFAQFRLKGKVFNAMSSAMPHDYDFTPGNSFVVECQTQEEIDYFWDKLGNDGKYSMCGWLEDKFGVSWQIIPAELPGMLSNPEKAQRITEALLNMQKLDIGILRNA